MNRTKLMKRQFEELVDVRAKAKTSLIDKIVAPYLIEISGQEWVGASNARELIRIAFESGYGLGHADASARDKENLLAEITGIS